MRIGRLEFFTHWTQWTFDCFRSGSCGCWFIDFGPFTIMTVGEGCLCDGCGQAFTDCTCREVS